MKIPVTWAFDYMRIVGHVQQDGERVVMEFSDPVDERFLPSGLGYRVMECEAGKHGERMLSRIEVICLAVGVDPVTPRA